MPGNVEAQFLGNHLQELSLGEDHPVSTPNALYQFDILNPENCHDTKNIYFLLPWIKEKLQKFA